MTTQRVRLSGAKSTMLMTLYLHAIDAGSRHPVLGDTHAAELVEQIDFGFWRFWALRGNAAAIVTRALLVDREVRAFVAEHPDALVLHLGCGLDSRVLRIDPPASVDWFELDQAEVIALRRRLYAEREGVTLRAISATDARWWSELPTGRPTLVVAEGLLMYLESEGVRALVRHLSEFDGRVRTLVADTVAPWVRRVGGWHPAMLSQGAGFVSDTGALVAALGRRPEQRSVVSATAEHSPWPLSAAIRLAEPLPAAREALVLNRVTLS